MSIKKESDQYIENIDNTIEQILCKNCKIQHLVEDCSSCKSYLALEKLLVDVDLLEQLRRKDNEN